MEVRHYLEGRRSSSILEQHHHPQQQMDIDNWPPAEPELAPGPQLLAVDTNVLINRLALVQALHKRLLASEVWLFVPHVVVRGE